jgi:hypothetical protein
MGLPPRGSPGGLMSSGFIYLGIVAIWAFLLLPRWLRRPHLLGGEVAEPDYQAPQEPADLAGTDDQQQSARRRISGVPQGGLAAPRLARSRVLQARRRLLTMLVTITVAAGVCTYLKLTSWWACVPPTGVLGMYLLLLREAALADAEQARWREAEDLRVQAARQRARTVAPERTAQIIDISARLGDQLYDQYADATIRAAGD